MTAPVGQSSPLDEHRRNVDPAIGDAAIQPRATIGSHTAFDTMPQVWMAVEFHETNL